jgi:hypothetical protein
VSVVSLLRRSRSSSAPVVSAQRKVGAGGYRPSRSRDRTFYHSPDAADRLTRLVEDISITVDFLPNAIDQVAFEELANHFAFFVKDMTSFIHFESF